jgi:hypothetical protein
MKRLAIVFILALLLVLAGAAKQPVHAHRDFCDTGCWAAAEGYIVGCRENGGDATTCIQRASQIYYQCLCNCRHTC